MASLSQQPAAATSELADTRNTRLTGDLKPHQAARTVKLHDQVRYHEYDHEARTIVQRLAWVTTVNPDGTVSLTVLSPQERRLGGTAYKDRVVRGAGSGQWEFS